MIPTVEDTIAQYGVHADGLRTTPLAGQPDLLGGLTPAFQGLLQGQIENNYRRFIGLVGASRHKTPEQVDAIGQGRIWDGGTARQNGLVDQFGGLDDALAWTAKAAKVDKWHPVFLGSGDGTVRSLLEQMVSDDGDAAAAPSGDLAGFVALRQQALADRLMADAARLLSGRGAQAYCLECAVDDRSAARPAPLSGRGWLALLARLAP